MWQIKVLFWVVIAIVIVWLSYFLGNIIIPVFVAFFLAYLLHPLMHFLEKQWKIPRLLTVSCITGAGLLVLVLVIALVIPLFLAQAGGLMSNAGFYLRDMASQFGIKNLQVNDRLEFFSNFSRKPEDLISYAWSALGTTAYVAFVTVAITVLFFYFSMTYKSILNKIKYYLPRKHQDKILDIVRQMDSVVGSFFRVRVMISITVGFLFSAGWYITGVPYWFLFGMVTGVLGIVPYLSGVGWIAAVLAKFFEASQISGRIDWVSVVVWPSVAFQLVNAFEEYILCPWLQRKTTHMSAVALFVVVIIGGSIGGFFGLLMSVPIAAMVKIFFDEVIKPSLLRSAGHEIEEEG